ncbi:MAG: hypothetical protein B7X31_00030 [Thiomonas sp. 13-66-29]|jgi:hypothetical protein|nr:MAG: hypothetical protein B7X31_00030 [Thiomonas sp. 13-66-29]
MIILVSDTSVLVDLERGGLLEAAFSCGLPMVVPDILYERELENQAGPYLRTLGLGVLSLTSDEVALAQRIRSERRGLSLPDCFALCCATRPDHVLLTGDKALRSEAAGRLVAVYGLLWLLDQMATSERVSTLALCEGLDRIAVHPRCRLPQGEIRRRLELWRSSL